MWILLAILAVPIIEIALFVQLGPQIGVAGTLIEVLVSAALGIVLMRLEPQRNTAELRAALARDQSPASPLGHSALRLLGAVLIVLPGFFTDALGLLMLLPPLRTLLLGTLIARLRTAQARDSATIIEGAYEVHNDDVPPTPRDRIEGDVPQRPEKRD